MITQRSLGPARKACTRCRLHKRRCDIAQPSCSLCTRLGQLCIYEDATATTVTPPMTSTNEAPNLSPSLEELTPSGIKANICRSLSNTNPREIMTIYSQTIHLWFAIFSETELSNEHLATWDSAPVDFTLLCFTIVLLNSAAPQASQGAYILDSEHRSRYLMSKSWIALLEAAGLNSMDFVKAKLLVTVFEVAHGFYPAAYLSIAATARAADVLFALQQQGISQPFSEKDMVEYRIMLCGIEILDRYITAESGSKLASTRDQQHPPNTPICKASRMQEIPSTPFARLFEASLLLDNVNRAVYQPTSQQSFNVEEMIMIVRTIQSFETVVNQTIPKNNRVLTSCLTLASIAKLLAFDHGCKMACLDQAILCHSEAITSLDALIDSIVEMVAVLNCDNSDAADRKPTVPPFAAFLVYKAAAITTERLQACFNTEVNFRRLKVLRNGLRLITQIWLVGERYLNLLDEDTTPRILKAVEGSIWGFTC